MLILLLAIMIESSRTFILHRPRNVTVHRMLVHYIDDILQTGHVKKEVANAFEVSVKCYRIKDKSNGDSGN